MGVAFWCAKLCGRAGSDDIVQSWVSSGHSVADNNSKLHISLVTSSSSCRACFQPCDSRVRWALGRPCQTRRVNVPLLLLLCGWGSLSRIHPCQLGVRSASAARVRALVEELRPSSGTPRCELSSVAWPRACQCALAGRSRERDRQRVAGEQWQFTLRICRPWRVPCQ